MTRDTGDKAASPTQAHGGAMTPPGTAPTLAPTSELSQPVSNEASGDNEALGPDVILERISVNVPGFIFQYRQREDGSACFDWASEGIYRIYGVTREEAAIDASRCFAQIHEDDLPRIIKTIEESANCLTKWDQIWRVRHRDRGIIWVHGQSKPITLSNGDMLWHGSVLDVTERKMAEEKVRTRENRLTAVLAAITDGVLVIDQKGQIEDANTAALSYLESSAKEITTRHVGDFFPPNSDENKALLAIIGTSPTVATSIDTIALSSAASVIPLRVTVGKMMIGEQEKLLITLADRREIRRAQRELAHLQKMEALGQLTGGVAHDFNNLLAVLSLNLELIRDIDDQDGRQTLVSQSLSIVDRGTHLTDQLLTFARRSKLKPKAFRFTDIIDSVRLLLTKVIGDNIRLETNCGSVWLLMVDPSLLENALLNLAINARDAMPSGGTIRLSCSDASSGSFSDHGPNQGYLDRDMVVISVEDTGSGMPKEVVERASEPFFTTKEAGKGSGLGLSMVHGFVTQSDGSLHIDSQSGAGTRVSLFLPRHADTADAAITSDTDSETTSLPRGNNKLVLLVEDDPALRRSVRLSLESLGYRVITAENSDQALARLSPTADPINGTLPPAIEPDIVLSDYRMPGTLNGLELLCDDRITAAKRILMSGFAQELDQDQASAARIQFVAKPFSRASLATALAQPLPTGP